MWKWINNFFFYFPKVKLSGKKSVPCNTFWEKILQKCSTFSVVRENTSLTSQLFKKGLQTIDEFKEYRTLTFVQRE